MKMRKMLRASVLMGMIWSFSVDAQLYTLDQSFTSPNNEGANINDGFAFVAQTFTAGLSGTLAAVSVDIVGYNTGVAPLRIEIRGVSDGHPNEIVLGSTTLASRSSSLSDMIFFSQVIPITAGSQYAIVANYVGAPPHGPGNVQGGWGGAGGATDYYPGGGLFASNDEVQWEPGSGPGYYDDQHFETWVVVPEPPAFAFGALAALGVAFIIRRR